METKMIILAVFLLPLVLLLGCKEDCDKYAPAGEDFPWTGYCTAEDVWDYCGCHIKTLMRHEKDTLMVKGRLLLGWADSYQEEWSHKRFVSNWNNNYCEVFLGSNPNERGGWSNDLHLHGDTTRMSAVRTYLDSSQMVYAVVRLTSFDTDGGCCAMAIYAEVLELVVTDGEEGL